MLVPKPLKKGDRVALIAPSGRIDARLVEKVKNVIVDFGYEPVVKASCYATYGYLAGDDALRANDVQQSFEDRSIAGIFCMRGGFGASKLLPHLNYEAIRANPKVFTGYSDITALHTAFNARCGFVTYLAPMPTIEFTAPLIDSYTVNSFKHAITVTDWANEPFANPTPVQALIEGQASGRLTGGNLTLLASSLGTPYEIDTKNKIVLLEDVDESPKQIDRLLTQLQQAGKLTDAAGFLLGNWVNCKPWNKEHNFTLDELWQQFFQPLQKPVLQHIAFGHCTPMMTLPLGQRVTIDGATIRFY